MSISEADQMWNLGLHKSMIVSEIREYGTRVPRWKVTRVPGGWIYERLVGWGDQTVKESAAFVPLNSEFVVPNIVMCAKCNQAKGNLQ